jgi:hypothetical protein
MTSKLQLATWSTTSPANRLPWKKGVTVFDSTGAEVTWDGTSPLTLKQLVVTYPFQSYTWSDGTPGSIADFELSRKIDCDPTGGATGYITCESIQDVVFSTDALEYTVTYLPGVQSPHLLPAAVWPVPEPPGVG